MKIKLLQDVLDFRAYLVVQHALRIFYKSASLKNISLESETSNV